MGHYYTEMACPKCGNPRCTCPPSMLKQTWVVKDLMPLKGSFGKESTFIFDDGKYIFTKAYATEEEAEASIPERIRKRIAKRKQEILALEIYQDLLSLVIADETVQ